MTRPPEPERRPDEMRQPYRGLVPYSEADARYFFGRERETDLIIANLLSSRLTVLYGESGAGKSSVLRAGVSYAIGEDARNHIASGARPRLLAVTFASWRDNAMQDLIKRIEVSLRPYVEDRTIEPTDVLEEALQRWQELAGCRIAVILDQFEEYFLYNKNAGAEAKFELQLASAINSPDLNVNFLISLRSDALSKLDRFRDTIPSLFDNYLRIEHLDREAAREAIERPIDAYNAYELKENEEPVSIDPELVDRVLAEVGEGDLAGTITGQLVTEPQAQAHHTIETAYLQLVMSRLWQEDITATSRRLRLQTFSDKLGGAAKIAQSHLDKTMAVLPWKERAAVSGMLRQLVTPSGTKIAHEMADLTEYSGASRDVVEKTLTYLASGDVRVLREVNPAPGRTEPRYEIYHDVLAASVLAWRTGFLQAQTRRVRIRLGAGVALLACLAAAGFLFAGVSQDAAAEANNAKAKRVVEVTAVSADNEQFRQFTEKEFKALLDQLATVTAGSTLVTPTPARTPPPASTAGSRTPTPSARTPGPQTPTPQRATPTAVVATSVSCSLPEKDVRLQFVNVRSGPDSSFPAVSFLRAGDTFAVTGWSEPRNFQSGKTPVSTVAWFEIQIIGSQSTGWASSKPVDEPRYICEGTGFSITDPPEKWPIPRSAPTAR